MNIARDVFSAIDSRLPFQKGLSVFFVLLIVVTSVFALIQCWGTAAQLRHAQGLSILGLLIGALAPLVSGAVAVYVYLERGMRRSVELEGERFVVMPTLARLIRVCGEASSLSAIVASPLGFLSVLLGGNPGTSALIQLLGVPFRGHFLLAMSLFLFTLLFAVLVFLLSYALAEMLEMWASMANNLGALREANRSRLTPPDPGGASG